MQRLLIALSVFITACSSKVYEYNTFSVGSVEGFRFGLSPELSDKGNKIVYGAPYSFYLSYKDNELVKVDVDVQLVDENGKVVFSLKVKDRENKPNIYFFIVDRKVSVHSADYSVRVNYSIKNNDGSVKKGAFDEKLFFKRSLKNNEILF